MVRDPFAGEDAPDLQAVLDALDDPDARDIVTTLIDESMTAHEISESCDLPLSTTYRKLDRLTEASLLDGRTAIRTDGHHTTEYVVSFETVRIALEERDFSVSVSRPSETADERLARLWTEVRKET